MTCEQRLANLESKQADTNRKLDKLITIMNAILKALTGETK